MSFSPNLGRWLQDDPLGFEAGDVDLYRYVGNSPADKTDPSGLEPGISGQQYNVEKMERMRKKRQEGIEEFKKACAENKIDPKTVDEIVKAVGEPFPYGVNPCKRWAEVVEPKLPERTPGGIIKGTERPGPGGKGTVGVEAGQWAWTYTPCAENLWCIFVDGHFAIRIKLPDGRVYYFDDGNWGGVFKDGQVPSYAK